VLTREAILRTLADNRDALRSLGVRRLGLFGSFARDTAGPDSDLDFVVELERKTFDSYMDLKLLLEDLFGRRVDLVLEDGIKSDLREQILADMIDAAEL
jgi:hypothetical protein